MAADGYILLMTIDSIYTLCIWLFPPTAATAQTRHRLRHRTACPVKSPGQPRCCCETARLFESPPPTSRPHPHPDPAIPVSSSRPISISTQISHSKSGHSDAALRLNPPPSRNTSVLPPLRNKRALAMPWAWTSSPTAMASSSSSSCFSPSSSAHASFARAASVLLSSTTKTTAYLALVALCLPMALGHDHSVENIPDGDATSPEPIVRQTFSLSAAVFSARPQTADLTRLVSSGLDVMGSHIRQYARLWRAVPSRHGAGRKSAPLLKSALPAASCALLCLPDATEPPTDRGSRPSR